jgi:murein DD-endopeptidase MepM/ murein hydrolase activator NlpD
MAAPRPRSMANMLGQGQPWRRAALCGPIAIILSSCIPPAGASVRQMASPVAADTAAQSRPANLHPPIIPPAARAAAINVDASLARQGGVLRGTITPAGAVEQGVRLSLDGVAVPLANDGQFLIAFDRDAPATATLRLTIPGLTPVAQTLAVQPGQWRIQNIDAPLRGSASSDAEFERRRPAELAQMSAARATVVSSDGWQQSLAWPVRGRISGWFGSQRIYRGTPSNYHNGLDIAVPTGTQYVAPADGVVILAATAPFTLEGNLLMIDHGGGLSSVFLHSSRLLVRTGDRVTRGQAIGQVGATGRATGPHLHWAMRWNGRKLDPEAMLSAPGGR